MTAQLNVLSLFAGIGGLELGLERAGMTTVGQVELDPFCRDILARHWPNVPQHDDVRTAIAWWLSEERPKVDVVSGGFPCQPFSSMGFKRGVADERWGWPWMLDVIAAVRPRYVVIENVAALLRHTEAFSVILSDLSDIGLDVEWSVVSACALGSPHTRRRLFMVAHPHGVDGPARLGSHDRRHREAVEHGYGRKGSWRDRVDWAVEAAGLDGRDVDGLAPGMVKAAGNAVVPQVAEFIGRLIVAHDSLAVAA